MTSIKLYKSVSEIEFLSRTKAVQKNAVGIFFVRKQVVKGKQQIYFVLWMQKAWKQARKLMAGVTTHSILNCNVCYNSTVSKAESESAVSWQIVLELSFRWNQMLRTGQPEKHIIHSHVHSRLKYRTKNLLEVQSRLEVT